MDTNDNPDYNITDTKNEKQSPIDFLNENDFDLIIHYFKNPENEAWNYKNEDGYSILHILIYRDLVDLLKQIIEIAKKITNKKIYKSFINSKSNKGISVFNFACYKGNMKIIKILLKSGADYMNKGNNDLSCLHYSAMTNKVTPIYYMIKKYNINQYEIDKEGNTFFHWACFCSSIDVINFFLNDENFDINIQNKQGITPLQYYILSNPEFLKPIKKLIRRGANPYIQNKKGENSFDIANHSGLGFNKKKEIIEILNRKNNIFFQKIQYYFFLVFHFLFVFFILILDFSYINLKYKILYVLWTIFIWKYIFIFINLEAGFIKNKSNNYLIELIDDDDNNINLRDYCIKCQVELEKNSKHCFYCKKCIKDFDHHCNWIQKCVGKKNKKPFFILMILFLFNCLFNFLICFCPIFWSKSSSFKHLIMIFFCVIYSLFSLAISIIIFPIFYHRYKNLSNNSYINNLNNKKEYLIENPQEPYDDENVMLNSKEQS